MADVQVQLRKQHNHRQQNDDAAKHDFHRKVAVCANRGSGGALPASEVCEAAFQTAPDGWQRAKEADNAACCDGARANVENVSATNGVGRHLTDWHIAWW